MDDAPKITRIDELVEWIDTLLDQEIVFLLTWVQGDGDQKPPSSIATAMQRVTSLARTASVAEVAKTPPAHSSAVAAATSAASRLPLAMSTVSVAAVRQTVNQGRTARPRA